jgi:uncharacterized membrane protein YbaN (DUF454 family)
MMSSIKKIMLILIGSVALILGTAGIFLPLLPTTPFLLLSAACYIKSSEKLYSFLINNKFLGSYIKNYREKKGIPRKTKIIAIMLLWISICYSTIFVLENNVIKFILFIVASGVTVHLIKIKTIAADNSIYNDETTIEQNSDEKTT